MISNELKKYIEVVIEDSFKSEGKENDAIYQYCIIQNNLILVLKTKYEKVYRRIIYRLKRNLYKNFKVVFDYNFDVVKGIDFNYSFAYWKVFGKAGYTITTYQRNPRCYELLNPLAGEPGHSRHIEKLKEICPEYTKLTWKEYSKIYEKMYNKKMYEVKETITNWKPNK